MSVSFVVAVWREVVHATVAKPWIRQQLDGFGGELIEVRNADSIFEAYQIGRERAQNRYIMYVHDDVRLLVPDNLSVRIAQAFRKYRKLGLIGPVGKLERQRVPWWLNSGKYAGHWCRRGNQNEIVYQYADQRGGAPYRATENDPIADWKKKKERWDCFAKVGLVDGFYLIEDVARLSVSWDTVTFGKQWHGYDVDRCMQAHALGVEVMVPPWLFLHDNAGHAGYKGSNQTRIHGRDQANRRINSAGDALWLADLDTVNGLLRRKWGLK